MAHERIFKFGATVRIFGRAQLSFSHASSSNLYTDGATKIQAPTRILFGPVYDLICVLPYLSRYPFLEMLLFCLFSSLALLALCLLLSAEEPCWFLSKSLPHETLPGLESDKDFLCSKMEKSYGANSALNSVSCGCSCSLAVS
jgi:hypothetical protein